MTVLGDHAVADDLRAVRQISRKGDADRIAFGIDGRIAPQSAGGVDQIDRAGRHAFIEMQLDLLRRFRNDRSVARFGGSERGMRRCISHRTDHQQQRQDGRETPHQGFVNLTPGAGHLPSWE